MLEFFAEGGFGMFPVLGFGLAAIAVGGRFAADADPTRAPLVRALAWLLVASTLHAMLLDVAAVLWFVADPSRAPDDTLVRTVFQGLRESTRPGALGGGLLVLALVLDAVGTSRAGDRARRAAAA